MRIKTRKDKYVVFAARHGAVTASYTRLPLSSLVSIPPPLLPYDTYKHFTYPKTFNTTLKNKILTRDNYTCQICNASLKDNPLRQVHHINYDKRDNLLLNLISLCKTCHGKTRYHRQYWYQFLYDKLHQR